MGLECFTDFQECCEGVCIHSGTVASDQVCCDGLLCDAGEVCCELQTVCCPAEFCCGNDQCCTEECEGCIDNGTLSGGVITVSPDPACLGDTITFTLSGVVDSGGTKRVYCTAKQDIPPVTLTYTWEITKPDATTVSGSGTSASTTADIPGTYACTFTATANRDCPPAEITIGPETASTVSNYETINIQYKTFIRCDFIEAVWPSPTWPFYSGDGRVFGQNGTNRTLQITQITVDPSNTNKGQVGTPTQESDISNGYITLNEKPPPYIDWCDRLCRFNANPEQVPSCSELSPGGYAVIHERVTNEIVKVSFKIFARAGCGTFLTPSIDSDLTVFVKQTCSAGVLDSVFIRFEGHMDAFPWHEIIVSGAHVIFVDPCLMLTDGSALLGPDDAVIVNTDWAELIINP